MVSRRNYFTIVIMMLVVFFLCMFINNMKEVWNDYTVNSYAEDASGYPSQINIYLPGGSGEDEQAQRTEGGEGEGETVVSRRKVICIGDTDGALSNMVREWVTYTKRDIAQYTSLASFADGEREMDIPEMLVIDPDCIHWEQEEEISLLTECVAQGIHLIFSRLPDVSVIENSEQVRELLGIRNIAEREVQVEGLHLYGGFLLGGEKVYHAVEESEKKYQDLEPAFPWYRLEAGVQVYMKGIPVDESVKPESYPAVIWRKSFGTAYVFAVNGGYMEGMTGIGFLSAMSADMYTYELYPAVNAQSMVFAGYPSLADENREVMDTYYSRSVKQLFQEILWPGITTTLQDREFGLTCMLAPQYDYQDGSLPDSRQLKYYLKIFNERSVETGLHGFDRSGTLSAGKLAEDQAFLTEALDSYHFSSFYAGNLKEEEIKEALQEEVLSSVKTVVTKPEEEHQETVGFLSEQVTRQRVTGDGLNYSYRGDLLVRSMETALGYLNISFDLTRVAYPEGEEDLWENLAVEFARTAGAYGKDFQGFDRTTASECDAHIRCFLGLDYEDSRTGDTIRLQTSDTGGTVWFILRTHNEKVKDMEGGSWRKLEEDAFLIEVEDEEVVITLEPSEKRYYY